MGRVKAEKKPADAWRESGRRIAVWIVVIACHLGALMLFLRPVSDAANSSSPAARSMPALKLRFVHASRPSAPPQVLPPAIVSSKSVRPTTVATRRETTAIAKPVVTIPYAPAQAPAIPAEPGTAGMAGGDSMTDSDGGFQDRLRAAQRGSPHNSLPGSDKAFVPGMHFVNPMDQGIGAVVRKAQRLFGVKSRQCIDVETWRSLTPQELSARHISPDEVDREDQRYGCNEPPGLHF
jgi:hypothetical protein